MALLLWLGSVPSDDRAYDSIAPCREASGKARVQCEHHVSQPAASRTERKSTDYCASPRLFMTLSCRISSQVACRSLTSMMPWGGLSTAAWRLSPMLQAWPIHGNTPYEGAAIY